MFRGSKDHFALRCRQAGLSVRQIVLASYAASLLFGGIALWIMHTSPINTLLIVFGVGLGVSIIGWQLSRIEMPSNKEVFGE